MKVLAYVRAASKCLLNRVGLNRELDEEIRSHIQMHADDLERAGLSRAEAERRARLAFGGHERFKEECRDALGGRLVETTWRDVRFALRMLRKSPGFTAVAVLTLAMGIGANAAVFGLLNAIILKPLNVSQPQNLYMIEGQHLGAQSYLDYVDLRDRNRSFEGLIAYQISRAGLNTAGNPSAAWLYETSGNYFNVLGVRPYLGRFFHASDEHGPDSAPYLVLSYSYWQSRFSGDPGVIGRAVELNKYPYTILGVAPPSFRGTELFFAPDFWVPVVNRKQVDGYSGLDERDDRALWLIGRVKNGVSSAEATADLNSIGEYLAQTYPKQDARSGLALGRPGLLGDVLGQPVRAFLAALMVLAGLVLLGACANLGSLFAARTADRSREIAVRVALGSSPARIVRQIVTETLLVSLIGGSAGLISSVLLLGWLSSWHPISNFPLNVPVNADGKVYAIAFVLAVASGIFCGIVPARQAMRADPYQVIKSGSPNAATGRFAVRDLLVVAQVTICAVLLTSSIVAVRGMIRSLKSNFGFEPQNAILADTDLDMAGYSGAQIIPMQKRMLDAVATIPDVTRAGISDWLPLGFDWNSSGVFKDTTSELKPANEAAEAARFCVSPGYLEAAGTTLLAGRDFTWNDDAKAPRVAIVNREFARELFGSEVKALAGYFKTVGGTRQQVVGIVEDGKYETLTEHPAPAMFLPLMQAQSSSTTLVIRTNGDPRQLAEPIRNRLQQVDARLPLRVVTWNANMESALFPSRVATVSLGALGALAALLTVTGIFGMASYSVSKRLREFGIRVALGAQHKEVLRVALGRALRLLAFGSLAGLLLGVAAAKLLAFIVYQANPRDPVVLGGVVAAMLILGLLATWVPARRALKVDPLILLREE
jgi:predicted permease